MKQKTIKDLVQKMKKLDFCMMTTQDGRGSFHSRPMSNNKDVEYDGNSWFFTFEDSGKVRQLENDSSVSLIFQGEDMLFIHVYGHGKIIRQRAKMEEHWTPDLEMWFAEGLDTPGIAMVHVEATKIQYWHKEEEGEISL